eukprot:5142902-Pyramimonas_sp.AAC.1
MLQSSVCQLRVHSSSRAVGTSESQRRSRCCPSRSSFAPPSILGPMEEEAEDVPYVWGRRGVSDSSSN